MGELAREGTTEPAVMRDKLSGSNGDGRGNSFSLFFKLTTSRTGSHTGLTLILLKVVTSNN